MKKFLVITTIAIAGIFISVLIFGSGFFVGRSSFGMAGNNLSGISQFQPQWTGMGWSSTINNPANNMMVYGDNGTNRFGMMGSRNNGTDNQGMMGNGYNGMGSYGMMGNGYNGTGGYGMMGNGYNGTGGYGMMGNGETFNCGSGMMGYFGNDVNSNVEPISVDQAKLAFEDYLKELNNSDLEIKEIMIFDNNGYAQIIEKSTGIGAMELLVDPASLSVFPEYGPNMMWNLKYGHMGGNSMMGGYGGMMGGTGGMMGNYNFNSDTAFDDMTVTSEQALNVAQDYLDQNFPGYQTAEEATQFYGYYTIDILKDGTPTGMLSVNGFNEQVFFHSWHGTFIEMVE